MREAEVTYFIRYQNIIKLYDQNYATSVATDKWIMRWEMEEIQGTNGYMCIYTNI
jgi:hypothetical protein